MKTVYLNDESGKIHTVTTVAESVTEENAGDAGGARTETAYSLCMDTDGSVIGVESFQVSASVGESLSGDVTLSGSIPQAEYMYGCTPTAAAMLFGYYDYNGYRGVSFDNLVEGEIEINGRGQDGNAYDMDAFDTKLGNFTANEAYVSNYFERDGVETTPEEELSASFVDGGTELNTSSWSCLADFMGTGQYWRGNDNLSTTLHYMSLAEVLDYDQTDTFSFGDISRTIDWKYSTMLYGLNMFAESRGYKLNLEITGTYEVDGRGGDFTFERYMAEIDAGRGVLVSISGHSMYGYGYNAETREIIFDDTYSAGQRMKWNGTYAYAGANRQLQSITVIGLRTDDKDVDLSVSGTSIAVSSDATSTVMDSMLYAGTLYLSFTVNNSGADASASFKVGISIDGTFWKDIDVVSVEGNGSYTVTGVKLENVSTGSHQITVNADRQNSVEESSGSNNSATAGFQVFASGTSVLSGGTMTVLSGSVSKDMTITAGGCMKVYGTASRTIVQDGLQVVSSGGTAVGCSMVGSSAQQRVYSGGKVMSSLLSNGGALDVFSGGIAESLTISSLGEIIINKGGRADSLDVLSGGVCYCYGSMTQLNLEDGGFVGIYSGSVDGGIVNGNAYVMYEKGELKNAEIAVDGYVYAAQSGTLSGLKNSGCVYIAGNGFLKDSFIYSGGTATIASAGVGKSVQVSGGWLNVSSAAVLSNTVLAEGGSMSLRDGAVTSNTTVEDGGVIYCWSSAVFSGTLEIGGSVESISESGAAAITSYTFLVQQSQNIYLAFAEGEGGIAGNADITIDVTNAWGDYTLVSGDLSKLDSASITFRTGNSRMTGAIGTAVTLSDGKQLTLLSADNQLTLSVTGEDSEAPDMPKNISASILENKLMATWDAVTDFSGVSYELEYSQTVDFAEAITVIATTPSCSVALPDGRYYWRLRAVDGFGNVSDWSSSQNVSIAYVKEFSGSYSGTQTVSCNVKLLDETSFTTSSPASLRVIGSGYSVTVGNDVSLNCSGIRNSAILFGEDAYWTNTFGYGPHYDGTVTFTGDTASLTSAVGSCITAAGIVGKNLTVNFTGDAAGAENISFRSVNRTDLAANYAYGIGADENLTINGEFGGTVDCVFDFTNATSNRSASLYGFSADGKLTVDGDLSGTFYLCGIGATNSYAYGLNGTTGLTVTGEISGVLAVTAQNSACGFFGKDVSITVSGTVFAGTSAAANTREVLLDKLENFSANRTELLELSANQKAVFASGTGELTFTGNALVIGDVYLGSGGSIDIYGAAQWFGDMTSSASTEVSIALDSTSLTGCRITGTEAWRSSMSLTIDVSGVTEAGEYSLVAGPSLNNLDSVAMLSDSGLQNLAVGGTLTVGDWELTLTLNTENSVETLFLSVSSGSVPTPDPDPDPVPDPEPEPMGERKFFFGAFAGGLNELAAASDGERVTIYKNGAGWVEKSLSGGWEVAATGDFNGDSVGDFLVRNGGTLGAWTMNSDGTNGWKSIGNPLDDSWEVLGAGDLDANGTSDVLLYWKDYNYIGSWNLDSGSGYEWRGITQLSPGWEVSGVGDFNGDGNEDILLFNEEYGTVGAYLMNSDGSFTWKNVGNFDSAWSLAGIGDFNGDGTSDILLDWAEYNYQGAWLLDETASQSGWGSFGQFDPADWSFAGSGDFDGDGTDDLLLASMTTDALGARLVKNGTVTGWLTVA